MSEEVLLARAYLSRVAEPACLALWAAIRRDGPVDTAAAVRRGHPVRDVAAATAARRGSTDPHVDLDAAARHGLRFVVPESEDWPHFAFACLEAAALRRIIAVAHGDARQLASGEPVPPLGLWVRGTAELSTLGVRSVGIVGSRAATSYGEHVAAQLSGGLAVRGFTVVSGGAYGIDAAAHRAALAAGSDTVLVSAGGLDQAYPPTNARLYERVAESGLLVSESPPGSSPQRRRFLTRNRLIAALSTGTVVVEAARRSGAMNTAGHCLRLGRPLMAVPGPITSGMSAGCHEMIAREQDRAMLVTSVDDVLGVIGSASDLPLDTAAARTGSADGGDELRNRLDGLGEGARHVFDALSARRAVGVEELAVVAGLTPIEVIRSLPALELAGLVQAHEGGYRISPQAWQVHPSRGGGRGGLTGERGARTVQR